MSQRHVTAGGGLAVGVEQDKTTFDGVVTSGVAGEGANRSGRGRVVASTGGVEVEVSGLRNCDAMR